MERGGKVADVLQRIGMSPLAVIRTGMIQANMALLSSSRLQAHESEHLLEMLLGELVISSDRNLRQVACDHRRLRNEGQAAWRMMRRSIWARGHAPPASTRPPLQSRNEAFEVGVRIAAALLGKPAVDGGVPAVESASLAALPGRSGARARSVSFVASLDLAVLLARRVRGRAVCRIPSGQLGHERGVARAQALCVRRGV